MASNPNLMPPWKPGESGNPGGRPKGRSLTARLREFLDKGEINGKPIKDGKQVADLITETLVKGALAGDVRFLSLLYDRAEGRPKERIEAMLVTDDEHDDAELDGWALQRSRALARKGDREEQPGRPGGAGDAGAMGVGGSPGPPE